MCDSGSSFFSVAGVGERLQDRIKTEVEALSRSYESLLHGSNGNHVRKEYLSPKRLKNHTLCGHTHLYSQLKGVPPLPP